MLPVCCLVLLGESCEDLIRLGRVLCLRAAAPRRFACNHEHDHDVVQPCSAFQMLS